MSLPATERLLTPRLFKSVSSFPTTLFNGLRSTSIASMPVLHRSRISYCLRVAWLRASCTWLGLFAVALSVIWFDWLPLTSNSIRFCCASSIDCRTFCLPLHAFARKLSSSTRKHRTTNSVWFFSCLHKHCELDRRRKKKTKTRKKHKARFFLFLPRLLRLLSPFFIFLHARKKQDAWL
jgi:hypothetical protein